LLGCITISENINQSQRDRGLDDFSGISLAHDSLCFLSRYYLYAQILNYKNEELKHLSMTL
jgi:hypothetical protein